MSRQRASPYKTNVFLCHTLIVGGRGVHLSLSKQMSMLSDKVSCSAVKVLHRDDTIQLPSRGKFSPKSPKVYELGNHTSSPITREKKMLFRKGRILSP